MYMGTATSTTPFYDGTGNFQLFVNYWYNIVLTYDSVSGLKGYINGVYDGGASANGILGSNNINDFSIGTDLNTAGRYFSGLIHNVKIYDRALKPEEIRQSFSSPFCMFKKDFYKYCLIKKGSFFFSRL